MKNETRTEKEARLQATLIGRDRKLERIYWAIGDFDRIKQEYPRC